jgi:hypothetical protein
VCLQNLLCFRDSHIYQTNLHLENPEADCERFLQQPLDEVAAAHLRLLIQLIHEQVLINAFKGCVFQIFLCFHSCHVVGCTVCNSVRMSFCTCKLSEDNLCFNCSFVSGSIEFRIRRVRHVAGTQIT